MQRTQALAGISATIDLIRNLRAPRSSKLIFALFKDSNSNRMSGSILENSGLLLPCQRPKSAIFAKEPLNLGGKIKICTHTGQTEILEDLNRGAPSIFKTSCISGAEQKFQILFHEYSVLQELLISAAFLLKINSNGVFMSTDSADSKRSVENVGRTGIVNLEKYIIWYWQIFSKQLQKIISRNF